MDGHVPPPPPPPHGDHSRNSGLPPGNYDIFIIPPHSAGSGFLYLPSLKPHRNSFLAGSACTLLAVGVWIIIAPVLRQWAATVVASGGVGVILLLLGVGIAGWAWGKTQIENQGPGAGGGGGSSSGTGGGDSAGTDTAGQQQHQHSQPNGHASAGYTAGNTGSYVPPDPKSKPSWQRPQSTSNAGTWEKAREETRKREEERRTKEAAEKRKEELEKKVREAAEKAKWETARAREKEAREAEAREKIARERLAREKEAREKDAREREAREKENREKVEKEVREKVEKERLEKEKQEKAANGSATTPRQKYERPTAKSFVGTEPDTYSFRPYDDTTKRPATKTPASSIYSSSPSSYVSQPTARTTPPPSHRGPFTTKDPDKVVIKAVYLFNELFPRPVAQLVSGEGKVSDGLVLRITTEGMFVDDEIRGVGQREWDVKAWTLKLVESAASPNKLLHVLRASIRDTEGKKYVFVLQEDEAWKVAVGLQRLKRGTQVRALNQSAIAPGEMKVLLGGLGWL